MDSVPTVPSWERESAVRDKSEWTREREPSKPKSTSKPSNPASDPKRKLREKEKRLKCIYEDEGMAYGSDASDEETLTNRFTVAMNLRKTRIEEVFRMIRRARNVQLCFLVDVTGSMQSYIDGVRDSIEEILRKLTDDGAHVTFPGTEREAQSMTVAFVAYRDHGDSKQFEVLDFTSAVAFKAFSRGLVASGCGNDPGGCEDVFGGLDAALNLPWSVECGTKVIFHICDQPCHGREFHRGRPDGYPNGDPKGRTAQDLFSKMRAKGIQFHFGKITGDTDLMIQKFSEVYGEPITEFYVEDVDDIRESVISAVSLSIMNTVSASQRTVGVSRVERTFTIDNTLPDWSTVREIEGTFISYAFPESIKDIEDDVPLGRNKPKQAIVKLAKNPFGKGAERIAFYGKDLSTYVVQTKPSSKSSKEKIEVLKKDEDIVLKEYLHTGKGMNSAKRYELSNQMQTIASFFAQKFVKELKDTLGVDQMIKFIKIRTLSLRDSPPRFMSCERRFADGAKFVRFTNNAEYNIMETKALALGISTEFVQMVIAFSHWTYKASNRFLMVVDLEGVVGRIEGDGKTGVLLTDPAIHCQDLTRYGPMNHGPDGMKTFFRRHVCNQFCKDLDLEGFKC